MKTPSKDTLLKLIISSIVLSALIILIQVWFNAFPEGLIWRLLGTLGLVTVVCGVLIAIVSDMHDDQEHKKDNYLS